MIPSLGPGTAQGIQAGGQSPWGIQSPDAPTAAHAGPIPVSVLPELAARFPNLEMIELLGKGGMGAVYKARQTKLDRLVALKVLPSEFNRDPTFAERFLREARALARLDHPNIVAVHDFGEADGQPYFIMEFVEGANLRQVIRGGNLPADQTLAVVSQVCEALQFAHDEGIIHRDIKPENILLDKKGRVRIADFGLAKLLGPERIDHTLTATHLAMGTMNYMAPEQLENAARVDHRADIYSLGVVFYEMLTGQVPRGKFDPPSQKAPVDARLDEVVLRALESDPERRYQNVSEMQTAMAAITRTGDVDGRKVAGATAPYLESNVGSPSFRSAFGKIGLNLDIEAIKRQVEAPAIWLMVTGVLTLLIGLIGAVDTMVMLASDGHVGFWARWWGGGIAKLVFQFLSLPLGFLIILGSRKMMSVEMFGMARLACILALLPLGPAALLGVPIAIWALMILSHPRVRAAFRTDFELSPPARLVTETVRQMLLGPRRALCVGGVAVVVGAVFMVVVGIGLAWQERNSGLYQLGILALEVLGIANLLIAIFMFVASRSMATCQHHGLARLGSTLALAPLGPLVLLTIPIGLFAMSALKKPRILGAFGLPVSDAELQKDAGASPSSSRVLIFMMFVGGCTVGAGALGVVAGLVTRPWGWWNWPALLLEYGLLFAIGGLVVGSLLYGVYSEARRIFRPPPANEENVGRSDQEK